MSRRSDSLRAVAAQRAVIDMHRARPDAFDQQTGERWQRMWSHREELLKVARRRSVSAEDAEDAVHEAMLRAAEHADVEDERLGAWLTTVTMRLCVDRHRQVKRDVEVHSRPALAAPGPVPVEEAVCDRAEADWLAERSRQLPARQARALRLRSEGRDVEEIAREMGIGYEAVESLLARARRTLRRSLAGTLAAALWLCGRGRPQAGGGEPAGLVVTAAATVAVLTWAAVPPAHRAAPVPRPAPTASSYGPGRTAPSDRAHLASAADAATPASGPGPGAVGGRPRGRTAAPQLPVAQVSVPALPSDALPTVPAASSVPRVPALTRSTAISVPPVPAPDPPPVPARPAVNAARTGAPGAPGTGLK